MTKNYYNQNAKIFIENTLKADMTKIYQRFEKYLKKGDRILDLGCGSGRCGSGRDSLYFMNKGYDVLAVDYAEELVKSASKLLNKEVIILDMREMDFYEEFDAIWACASILHINREDINNVIRNCEMALKNGGIFYLSFKYGDKEEWRNERFFNYYNETSFKRLIDQFSYLNIIETWKTKDVRKGREDEFWLNVIIKKMKE
ncbi:methyltransferase domain-containing protein [Crassaminicella thermophila]|uniref:Methyltransferase domain-containing protein n=1 Tax=Crassaminicella thermophila TaxID=2599308 RepID=A0A5C0SBS4_CRATE|nr:class I SAM-dependent methyltransferase [Crassaminicella thermophila]QEK11550.1 methyltransferase domain-containing protein [Crassaminicella thermophila]